MAGLAGHESESDYELLGAPDGVSERYGVFYDRHFETVLAYFAKRTDDVATAADLTAETFSTAYLQRDRFEPELGTAEAWLLGIGRNLLRHYFRRQAVEARGRQRLGLPILEIDEISTARIERMADAGLRRELRAALDMLSPNVRDAVLLRVALELPYEEIAQRLRCSVGAARIRVLRGLSRLADRLEGW